MTHYREDKTSTEELGRAIARGMSEQAAQKERNMQKAERRRETMLENAAEAVLSGRNYS